MAEAVKNGWFNHLRRKLTSNRTAIVCRQLAGAAVGSKVTVQLLITAHNDTWDPDHHLRRCAAAQVQSLGAGQAAAAAAAVAQTGVADAQNQQQQQQQQQQDPDSTRLGPFAATATKAANGFGRLWGMQHNGELDEYLTPDAPYEVLLQEELADGTYELHIVRQVKGTERIHCGKHGTGRICPGGAVEVEADVLVAKIQQSGVHVFIPRPLWATHLHDLPVPSTVTVELVLPGWASRMPSGVMELGAWMHYASNKGKSGRRLQHNHRSELAQFAGRTVSKMSVTPDQRLTLYLAPLQPDKDEDYYSPVIPAPAPAAAAAAAPAMQAEVTGQQATAPAAGASAGAPETAAGQVLPAAAADAQLMLPPPQLQQPAPQPPAVTEAAVAVHTDAQDAPAAAAAVKPDPDAPKAGQKGPHSTATSMQQQGSSATATAAAALRAAAAAALRSPSQCPSRNTHTQSVQAVQQQQQQQRRPDAQLAVQQQQQQVAPGHRADRYIPAATAVVQNGSAAAAAASAGGSMVRPAGVSDRKRKAGASSAAAAAAAGGAGEVRVKQERIAMQQQQQPQKHLKQQSRQRQPQQQRVKAYLDHEMCVKLYCAANSSIVAALNDMSVIAMAAIAGGGGSSAGQQQQHQQQQLVQEYLGFEMRVKAFCAADSSVVDAVHAMSVIALAALTQNKQQ